jgi:sugar lactone lactonase YvrE
MRKAISTTAVIFLALLLLVVPAMAGITWQQTSGPTTTAALVIDPVDSQTMYAGTAAGVYKSTNAGGSWTMINQGFGVSNSMVNTLAIDPIDSRTIYAGTRSYGGLFKSTDSGGSWSTACNGLTNASGNWAKSVNALAIDPVSRQTVYAGTGDSGVFKSTDGGASWKAISPFSAVSSLAIDPRNSQTIYTGTSATTSSGVFKSTDGGASWSAMSSGLPYYNANIQSLLIDPTNSMVIYAGSYRSNDGGGVGVFKSTDGGASWQPAGSGLPATGTSDGSVLSDVQSLAMAPGNSRILYAGTSSGVYRSVDAGASWSAVSDSSMINVRSLALVGSKTIYAGGNPAFANPDSHLYKGTIYPTVSGTPAAVITAGNAYSFVPTADDVTRFSISGAPSWASFNSSTGALTGTPAASDVGSYQGIVISATDGDETASLPPFTITVKAVPTAPGAPTSVTAVPGDRQALVSYAASDGGSPITSVTITASPGNRTFQGGTANPLAVTGLINGVSYTFTVTATNSLGTGAISAPSNSVTPSAPRAPVQPAVGSIITYLGAGVAANLDWPQGVAVDGAGNLYLADNCRILKVAAGTGILTTLAGDGSYGYSGDNGPATKATFGYPQGLAVDRTGYLYIADTWNNRIRKVDLATGYVTTVAGNGSMGYAGDSGLATAARLDFPAGVALDDAGNLYIADNYNQRVRKVAAGSGIITTVAGNPSGAYPGDNGQATSAYLGGAAGVAVDGSGNFYIADYNVIRKVTAATGIITTVAGNGTTGYSGDGGPATAAALNRPSGLALDGTGNLLIADKGNHRVRRVDLTSGVITTVAGSNGWGYSGDGGAAASASLSSPSGVAVDGNGNIFIADAGNQRVRAVVKESLPAVNAVPDAPSDVVAAAGDARAAIYFTSPRFAVSSFTVTSNPGNVTASGNSLPIVVTGLSNGTSYSFTVTATNAAGTGAASAPSNGVTPGKPSIGGIVTRVPNVWGPDFLALDRSGNLYVSDGANGRVLRYAAGTGAMTIAAGSGCYEFSGPGCYYLPGDGIAAESASLGSPQGLAVDSAGNLYIADSENQRVRKVDAQTGMITTVAGNGSAGYSGDGAPGTSATLNSPTGLAIDRAGNLFVADTRNNRVRKVDAATGIITTIAGNGTEGFAGDNGAASAASLNFPLGLAADSAGNLYIADVKNNRVRRVSLATGVITSVAGTGAAETSGDNGPASAAAVNFPAGVAVDGAGDLYIAEYGGSRIRKVYRGSGTIVTVAGTGAEGYTGDNGKASDAALQNPTGVAVDGAGNLYIADTGNDVIRMVAQSTGAILPAGVPTGVTAQGGNAEATVSFTGSGFPDSGLAGISFTVTSSPGNLSATGPASPITVRGLTNGTAYTFTVTANDAAGTGAPSLPSNAVTPVPGSYPLTLLFAGTGGGSVHGAMARASGTACTPAFFEEHAQLTLLASPDSNSLFGGWSGGCTVSGNSCTVTMDAAKTVTANFDAVPQARIVGGTGYSLLSAAYSAAANNAVIQARAVLFDNGDLILNRPVSIFFRGGYDTGFNQDWEDSIIKGSLKVRSGTVRVYRLKLR